MVLDNDKETSITSEDILPIAIKAMVTAAEQTMKMNVNTDLIVAKLNNGLGTELRNIIAILRNEVIPKLNLDTTIIESKRVETEVIAKAKIEEIKARKEMYNVRFKFYGMLATLVLGGGGLVVAILKWIVIPLLGLPQVP